ncbi:alpha/beta fold hydrolase [Nocardioidaceae bacterium]|nr:alpha/beta fold hydrolase [Nocardioidaceae bacterium]
MPVTTVRLGGRPDQPLLLLGPAAGTSVQALWTAAARLLATHFQVVGWDLPGHGSNLRPPPGHDGTYPTMSLDGLARDVLDALDRLLDTAPGARPTPVHYAGHGIGGAVGLKIALDRPPQVASLAMLGCCLEPGGDVLALDPRDPGMSARIERDHPRVAASLRAAADRVDVDAVLAVRWAHSRIDLRARLGDLRLPVLAVHGAQDPLCSADSVATVLAETGAAGSGRARTEVLEGVGHLPAAEAPEAVAALVRDHALGLEPLDEQTPVPGSDSPLDPVTEALVLLALAAGRRGSTGEDGARAVLGASRAAVRAGAAVPAVARTLSLAWGDRDADGRLTAKVTRMLEADR